MTRAKQRNLATNAAGTGMRIVSRWRTVRSLGAFTTLPCHCKREHERVALIDERERIETNGAVLQTVRERLRLRI